MYPILLLTQFAFGALENSEVEYSVASSFQSRKLQYTGCKVENCKFCYWADPELCRQCLSGFYRTIDGQECEEVSITYVIVGSIISFLILIFCIVAVIYVLRHLQKKSEMKPKPPTQTQFEGPYFGQPIYVTQGEAPVYFAAGPGQVQPQQTMDAAVIVNEDVQSQQTSMEAAVNVNEPSLKVDDTMEDNNNDNPKK